MYGLCNLNWNENTFDGTKLISCPIDDFHFVEFAQVSGTPGFDIYTSPVAGCASPFTEITSGASRILTCPTSDFVFINRSEFIENDSSGGGGMTEIQYEGFYLLVFSIGLAVMFGLGAIKGGQR